MPVTKEMLNLTGGSYSTFTIETLQCNTTHFKQNHHKDCWTHNFISRLAAVNQVSQKDSVLGPGQTASRYFARTLLDGDALVVLIHRLWKECSLNPVLEYPTYMVTRIQLGMIDSNSTKIYSKDTHHLKP